MSQERIKHYARRIAISIAVGVVLTFGIGLAEVALLKGTFNPRGGQCATDPLCDPSPYLNIGLPWTYGNYSDADGSTTILNSQDDELTGRYYRGFIADTILYALFAFALLAILARIRKKSLR